MRLPSAGEGGEEEESLRDKRALQPVRTVRHEHGTGERILMTEDEDEDAYGEWKRKIAVEGTRERTVTKASRPGGLGKKIKKMPPVKRGVPEKNNRGEDGFACLHI